MTTEHRPRPPTTPAGPDPTSELKRIPLPPLPHFRRVGTGPQAEPATTPSPRGAPDGTPAGSVTHLEMSELLGPHHEGGIAPVIEPFTPQRTGATGATILNDLVDEIEKGLEKDLARAPNEAIAQTYRRTVACASGPTAGRSAGLAPPRPATLPSGGPERRTGE